MPNPALPVRPRRTWFVAALFAAYCAAIVFVACHHEFWEDEVRVWSVARHARSLPVLFASLRNDGHPALWSLLLYAGTRLSASRLVLPAASLLVAAAAAACLLLCSPLARWAQALLLAGVLPLYEYSVMARNYGLTLLGLFAAFALYPRRLEHPLALGLALALLANTSAHGMILALGFLLALAAEYALGGRLPAAADSSPPGPPAPHPRRQFASVAALLVVAAGVGASIATTWPDRTSAIFQPPEVSPAGALEAIGRFAREPGHAFDEAVWHRSPLLATALVWLAALSLLDKPFLLAAFLAGVVGLSLFFDLVYAGALRHQGLLVMLFAGMVWLLPAGRTVPLPRPLGRAVGFLQRRALPILLGLVLALHCARAYQAIGFDLTHEMTSAPRLGRFLRESFPAAIVVGEPDDALESLPFYASNPIYIARERRFGDWTRFTLANQRILSLGELVRIGRSLRRQTGRPVLLAFGHRLRPGLAADSYGRLLTLSEEEIAEFNRETVPVANFRGAATENYRVFSFR